MTLCHSLNAHSYSVLLLLYTYHEIIFSWKAINGNRVAISRLEIFLIAQLLTTRHSKYLTPLFFFL
jgi:hypothetical protein